MVRNEMSFIPKLKEFLLKNKKIYTVRKYLMQEADVYISGLGYYHRKPIGIVSSLSLSRYVKESGFDTVEDWIKMIMHFIGNDINWYLYEVTLVRNTEKVVYK